MLKTNPYLMTHNSEENGFIILDSYHSRIFKTSKEQAETFQKALCTLEGESEVLELLKKNELIYDDTEKKIEDYDELYDELLKETSDELELTLLPTEGCNFRCVYCYENHNPQIMSAETQDGIVNFVKKNLSRYKGLRISWFGGEPLCAKEIVNDLSARLREICKSQRKPYFAGMTTNAYLLDLETFQYMVKKNRVIDYQITIDGIEDSHDIQRTLADSKGTFQTILKNLRDIRDHVKSPLINIIVRCNVTKLVMEHFEEYVDLLSEEFGNDKRFSIFWKIAWDPETEERNIYCADDTMNALMKTAKGKKLRLNPIFSQYFRFGGICYASFPNSFVIGADALVYKCTVAFDSDRNHIGILHPDGTMELDEERYKFWAQKFEHEDLQKCRECKLAPSCLGIYCRNGCVDQDGNLTCPSSFSEFSSVMECICSNNETVERLEV